MEEAMKRVIVAVAIFLILAAGTALAASPIGQWDYKGFSMPGLQPGPVQGICFIAGVTSSDGTVSGTWFSTTFAGWSGQWFQNGDRIRFYGTAGAVSTAELGQFISNTRFSGEYVHFTPPAPVATNSLGNFSMTRTSSTCDPAAALADFSAANSDPAVK
jgi:hypothetical protein